MSARVTLNRRKIVVLGSRSVGKSSLIKQLVDNSFSDSYYPTVPTTSHKSIWLNGVEYPCEIVDTAGQDEFSQLHAQHAIGIHGYVLVYSITSKASFEMMQIIYDKILYFCGGYRARQVSSTDGQNLAQGMQCAWIETSARLNENVGQVFELCLEEIERHNAPPKSPQAPPDKRTTNCILM
ncbi:rheb small monomeric GTPase RhbA [Mycena amicta]|nr:rheb small monomeric GTPase RhbA [Mycena amicta]